MLRAMLHDRSMYTPLTWESTRSVFLCGSLSKWLCFAVFSVLKKFHFRKCLKKVYSTLNVNRKKISSSCGMQTVHAVEAAGKCEMRNGFKGRCVTRTEELTCSSWIVVEISKYFLNIFTRGIPGKTKQIRKWKWKWGRKSWHVHHGLWSFSLWVKNWLPTCWCDVF